MMIRALLLLCSLPVLAAVSPAQAETADRSLPIEIVAQTFHGDEIEQTAVYIGAVEVHQGTLEVHGDRLHMKIAPDGYRTFTVTGKPARFKERRDMKTPGVEEWVYARSLTAIYDERNDTITLKENAKLVRTENGDVKDTTEGTRIVYDMRNARSFMEGEVVDGTRSRVSTVLAPRRGRSKRQDEPPAPVQPPLRTAPGLGK